MASQALYRKWRSQTFAELVGQEHVVQTLRNAIVEERVAHAYLFTGPRGVGKTSMARLLAKAVNCTAPKEQRPCGICDSCQAISEGRAVDIIEMDAASHTSVDDAREIIERVQFRPTSGRYKVYVIDEVHMLSTAAFNALLKTLEEPPDHAIFILATTEVHKIPATILSRCQRFTFTRHTVAATASHLQRIAAAEGVQLAAGVAEAIARAATGSMRDALGVLEQLSSFASGQITLDQVQSLLGMTSAAEVNALISALLANDLGAALRSVNGVADQGADLRQFTRDLVERLRMLMLLAAANDHELLDVSEDELALLEDWAHQADVALLVQWIKVFSNLDYQLRTSPYGHLPLELAVVEALVAPPALSVAQPAASGATARPVVQRTPQAAPATVRTSPAPPPNPTVSPSTTRAVATPPAPSAEQPAKPAAIVPAPDPSVEQAKPTAAPAPDPSVEQAKPAAAAPAPAPTVEPAQPVAEPAPATPASTIPIDELLPPIVETSPLPSQQAGVDQAAVQAANADISILEQIEAIWPDVVRDVRVQDPMVQALLKDMRPEMVEDDTLVLLAAYPFHKKQLENPQKKRIVEEVLSKHLGQQIFIRCTTEQRSETQDVRNQIREVRKDPLVKAAMNIFGATVVNIEPPEQ